MKVRFDAKAGLQEAREEAMLPFLRYAYDFRELVFVAWKSKSTLQSAYLSHRKLTGLKSKRNKKRIIASAPQPYIH
jgi:hypothetical protein